MLAPVFLFAASDGEHTRGFWLAAVCQFLCLYPASHGFNSFYDRDEGSIAGVKSPPKVEGELIWVALGLDVVGLGIAAFVSWEYFVLVLVYGLVSKAYSHPWTRWKAKPWFGWLVVSVFQGAVTYVMSYVAVHELPVPGLDFEQWFASGITTLWIASSYPLTQIYQHTEDSRRGDKTLSLWLGVNGTFAFTAIGFVCAQACLAVWAGIFSHWNLFWCIQAGFLPSALYFLWWSRSGRPRFENAMAMSWLSATGVNIALILYSIL